MSQTSSPVTPYTAASWECLQASVPGFPESGGGFTQHHRRQVLILVAANDKNKLSIDNQGKTHILPSTFT